MRRAFITGITGQDGSYLTELLLEKGYEVHGTSRSTTGANRLSFENLPAVRPQLNRSVHVHWVDSQDSAALGEIIRRVAPEEIYHLASHSDVSQSFERPEKTCADIALEAIRLLEIVRHLPAPPRFFFPSSAHIFGRPAESPQDEQTPQLPLMPYGCAKAFAAQMVRVYRESIGLFAGNGILFNHESPRRGESFVSQKICRAAAAIKLGLQQELLLGDLTVQRDWGHARDFVRGMWLMLQQDRADDFVLATGELHSVQEIVELAFTTVGLDWRDFVRPDPRFLRLGDAPRLVGNSSKAQRVLGWKPTVSFAEIVQEMTQTALLELRVKA